MADRTEITRTLAKSLVWLGDLTNLARRELHDAPIIERSTHFRGLGDWEPYIIELAGKVFLRTETDAYLAERFFIQQERFLSAARFLEPHLEHFSALHEKCVDQSVAFGEVSTLLAAMTDYPAKGALTWLDAEGETDYVMDLDTTSVWVQVGQFQVNILNHDTSVQVDLYPYREPSEENGFESGATLDPIASAEANTDEVAEAFEGENVQIES